jgi:hypothetical protein
MVLTHTATESTNYGITAHSLLILNWVALFDAYWLRVLLVILLGLRIIGKVVVPWLIVLLALRIVWIGGILWLSVLFELRRWWRCRRRALGIVGVGRLGRLCTRVLPCLCCHAVRLQGSRDE